MYSLTSPLIAAINVSFSASEINRSIQVAICNISPSFIPLDVTAGVPRRIPEVTNGDWCHRKAPCFCWQVISAFTKAFSANFARHIFIPQVNQHQVIVGTARKLFCILCSPSLRLGLVRFVSVCF
jgi:hypothetical protein